MSSGGLQWYSEPNQQRRTVKKLHRMDGNMAYGAQGQLFDIAIIEVDTPFDLSKPGVIPAKLPIQRTSVGTNVLVSGWGTTSQGDSSNPLTVAMNKLQLTVGSSLASFPFSVHK